MRIMPTERAAAEIRRAYGVYRAQHPEGTGWMSLATLADRLDLTHGEIETAILHLVRTDRQFTVVPESNQKMLTVADWDAAVWIGGQWKHWISWDW
ncbi:hypothetical protein [Micromonospora yangpuensis]|uniref:Winged helix-turn-helix domain-containing protein n=1 Tax=Micromonospora yangpuensis TaxID=683228 RepID=A0A1C6VE85_9ACTN|nr:hypothetical protein [Micromonospora yangpuensis]GGM14413.1 hypothetical protein GCM10012279_35650 [Micromonospora yangpuensis]SCL64648.1 hypothetical protein GA0070617_5521 [Micromonospora yangpuensis]